MFLDDFWFDLLLGHIQREYRCLHEKATNISC